MVRRPEVSLPVAVESRFDQWSVSYEDSDLQRLLFDPVHDTVVGEVARHVVDRSAVLDVGCGTGRLLRRLDGVFAASVGVDPAAGMLVAARRLGTRADLVAASAERLPLPDRSFSLVTATLSARHWADLDAGVAELARVLAPGGLVVVGEARAGRAPYLAGAIAARHELDVVACVPAPVRGPVPPADVVTLRRSVRAHRRRR
jgi:ubiquinone/menaquinone biosynthesis C-methylase UbiE